MARLAVKDGVQPHLIHILVALANVVQDLRNAPDITITSGIDGRHSSNSLHYALRAVDIRIRDLTVDTIEWLVDGLNHELGHGYDVVLEDDHIHVEYDPK